MWEAIVSTVKGDHTAHLEDVAEVGVQLVARAGARLVARAGARLVARAGVLPTSLPVPTIVALPREILRGLRTVTETPTKVDATAPGMVGPTGVEVIARNRPAAAAGARRDGRIAK
jgi:hypothetical protein